MSTYINSHALQLLLLHEPSPSPLFSTLASLPSCHALPPTCTNLPTLTIKLLIWGEAENGWVRHPDSYSSPPPSDYTTLEYSSDCNGYKAGICQVPCKLTHLMPTATSQDRIHHEVHFKNGQTTKLLLPLLSLIKNLKATSQAWKLGDLWHSVYNHVSFLFSHAQNQVDIYITSHNICVAHKSPLCYIRVVLSSTVKYYFFFLSQCIKEEY